MVTALEEHLELHPGPARHVEWTLSSAALTVINFAAVIYGMSGVETSGSAGATINVYDGPDHTGLIVIPIKLASGESFLDSYTGHGLLFKNAVHINVSSGQAQGAVFYRRVKQL